MVKLFIIWKWMKVDDSEWLWMIVDESRCKWRKVGENGWKWMEMWIKISLVVWCYMYRWCLFSLNDRKGVATKLSGMGFLSGLVLRQCQHRLCPSTATSQWGCCCNIYHYCTDWFASDWWPFTILKFVKPTIFQRALLGGILTQKQGFTGEGVVTDHSVLAKCHTQTLTSRIFQNS